MKLTEIQGNYNNYYYAADKEGKIYALEKSEGIKSIANRILRMFKSAQGFQFSDKDIFRSLKNRNIQQINDTDELSKIIMALTAIDAKKYKDKNSDLKSLITKLQERLEKLSSQNKEKSLEVRQALNSEKTNQNELLNGSLLRKVEELNLPKEIFKLIKNRLQKSTIKLTEKDINNLIIREIFSELKIDINHEITYRLDKYTTNGKLINGEQIDNIKRDIIIISNKLKIRYAIKKSLHPSSSYSRKSDEDLTKEALLNEALSEIDLSAYPEITEPKFSITFDRYGLQARFNGIDNDQKNNDQKKKIQTFIKEIQIKFLEKIEKNKEIKFSAEQKERYTSNLYINDMALINLIREAQAINRNQEFLIIFANKLLPHVSYPQNLEDENSKVIKGRENDWKFSKGIHELAELGTIDAETGKITISKDLELSDNIKHVLKILLKFETSKDTELKFNLSNEPTLSSPEESYFAISHSAKKENERKRKEYNSTLFSDILSGKRHFEKLEKIFKHPKIETKGNVISIKEIT